MPSRRVATSLAVLLIVFVAVTSLAADERDVTPITVPTESITLETESATPATEVHSFEFLAETSCEAFGETPASLDMTLATAPAPESWTQFLAVDCTTDWEYMGCCEGNKKHQKRQVCISCWECWWVYKCDGVCPY